jgi:hypothetical protein
VNWKGFGREALWHVNFLECLKKTTRNLNRVNRCSDRDSNRDRREYIPGALPPHQPASTLWKSAKKKYIWTRFCSWFVLIIIVLFFLFYYYWFCDWNYYYFYCYYFLSFTSRTFPSSQLCIFCGIAISECPPKDCNLRKCISVRDISGNRGYTWKLSMFSVEFWDDSTNNMKYWVWMSGTDILRRKVK